MYAIAEIAGSQVKFSNGDTIRVPKLSLEIGENLTIEKFLLTVTDDGAVTVGKPYLTASASATVVEHKRDPKSFCCIRNAAKDLSNRAVIVSIIP